MKPPAPSRPYWICQAAGWGGFVAYVLGAYLLTVPQPHAADISSIVFFNGVACPALTHGLRHWMYVHGWHELRGLARLWRMIAVIAGFSVGLTCAVQLWVLAAGGPLLSPESVFGILAGFAMAFAGWLTIYFAVHARRERDALQWQLTLVTRDAQLRALRAQLNPHFLFNCLNSLRHLIVRHPERAEMMVTSLAELLRYSLASDRREFVTLSDELHIVDEYLELERVRLEERLKIERNITPDAMGAMVPPMAVQLLVENAIKHGIAELVEGGVVRIDASIARDQLAIGVCNTGTLKSAAGNPGHGLDNLRGRLRLLYDGAASFDIRERENLVEARLVIPVSRA